MTTSMVMNTSGTPSRYRESEDVGARQELNEFPHDKGARQGDVLDTVMASAVGVDVGARHDILGGLVEVVLVDEADELRRYGLAPVVL